MSADDLLDPDAIARRKAAKLDRDIAALDEMKRTPDELFTKAGTRQVVEALEVTGRARARRAAEDAGDTPAR